MDSHTPPMTDDLLHGYYLEDLEIGMSAVYGRTIVESDVSLFAGLSGDDNPLHVHENFASRSRFEGRVVHGAHTASLISAVIGTRMPGPGAIYLSQNSRFKAPVRIGDTVDVRATVTAIDRARNQATISTVCCVGETVVIDGEARVWVPSRAGPRPDDGDTGDDRTGV